MHEEKIISAVLFLSLDSICDYENALWMSTVLAEGFKPCVSKVLARYFERGVFHQERSQFCFEVFQVLKSRGLWTDFYEWTDVIYLNGVADRYSEQMWALIFSTASNMNFNSVSTHNRIQKFAMKVIQDFRKITGNRSDEVRESFMSRNAYILREMCIEPETIFDKIELMIKYNLLVELWAEVGPSEVHELIEWHSWGKAVAASIGLRETDVPFPGAWNYSTHGRLNHTRQP